MKKSDLVNELKQAAGGASFIKTKDLQAFLGKSDRHGVYKLTNGMERIDGRYFIPDIAEALMSRRTVFECRG